MAAKPYSASHIGALSSAFTEMRLSGAVKEQLVELLCEEISRLVPQMESETLSIDPERKTLDDPQRTRLNYNRTRELMIGELQTIESVSSAAVQAAISHLEDYLQAILSASETFADKDRVGTIKPRHLEAAVQSMGLGASGSDVSEELRDAVAAALPDATPAEDIVVGQSGGVLTEGSLASLARSHAGMSVTPEAARELLDMYYMAIEQLEYDIRSEGRFGSNPAMIIDSINQMRTLMGLGWMRRVLRASADDARERGYKRIDVEQIVNIDPFA